MLPADVAAFRAAHRATIAARYRSLHLALTSTVALAAIAVARVRAPSPLELLAVPVLSLLANLGEYLGPRRHGGRVPARMAIVNFNITFPSADRLSGTAAG